MTCFLLCTFYQNCYNIDALSSRPLHLPSHRSRRHGINCDEQIPVVLVARSATSRLPYNTSILCIQILLRTFGYIPLITPSNRPCSTKKHYTVHRTLAYVPLSLSTGPPPSSHRLITSRQLFDCLNLDPTATWRSWPSSGFNFIVLHACFQFMM
jgi:hypothetical protein